MEDTPPFLPSKKKNGMPYLCSMSMHCPSLHVNWPEFKREYLAENDHFGIILVPTTSVSSDDDQPAEQVVSLIGLTLDEPTTVLHLSSRTPEKSTSFTPEIGMISISRSSPLKDERVKI